MALFLLYADLKSQTINLMLRFLHESYRFPPYCFLHGIYLQLINICTINFHYTLNLNLYL